MIKIKNNCDDCVRLSYCTYPQKGLICPPNWFLPMTIEEKITRIRHSTFMKMREIKDE